MKIVAAPESGKTLQGIWPEFLHHDDIGERYWGRLYPERNAFQFLLLEDDEVVAEGNSIPVHGHPAEWRDGLVRGFESAGEPDRLCALAIMVAPAYRGRGISRVMLEHMRGLAAPWGRLVAPVRPTAKAQHPLVPIGEYVLWRRDDGTHFDPWIRTHEQAGGVIEGPAENAMVVDAPVENWREWTGLPFAGDGEHVVPGALVPVRVEGGRGVYREPCVWIRHAAA